MKSLHNLNWIYCSCTSLFMAFTPIAVDLGCVLHLASCHYSWHHHHQFSAPYLQFIGNLKNTSFFCEQFFLVIVQLIGLSEVFALPEGMACSAYWLLLMTFFSLQSLQSRYFSPMYSVLSNRNINISGPPHDIFCLPKLNTFLRNHQYHCLSWHFFYDHNFYHFYEIGLRFTKLRLISSYFKIKANSTKL